MYSYPTIANTTMTVANTEYSYAVPANTKKVLIKERSGSSAVKLAYTSGQSGTTYITIPAGSTKYLEGAWLTGITLYFQCADAGKVIETEIWK